jgi:mRNA interferase RelE/StbE
VPRYGIQILPSAERELAALDSPIQRRIAARIDALADTPRPSGAKKLQGGKDTWRVRVGDYRILYEVVDERVIVLVVKVGHRREVYR